MRHRDLREPVVARAFAKINLGLEVLSRRPDGYHELCTVLQTVDFCDLLTFRLGGGDVVLETNDPHLSTGPDNLVHRAARLIASERKGSGPGVHIRLDKRVPAGRGLGGGSADAAMTLVVLNRLWSIHAPKERLQVLGSQIGMDVPFFVEGGTALALGRGDELRSLDVELDWPIVLALPDFSISTAAAYGNLILTKRSPDLTLQRFRWGDPYVRSRLGELVNDLEEAAGEHLSTIHRLKQDLLELGATGAMMSGSGSSVFGVFHRDAEARSAAASLIRHGVQAIATRTLSGRAYRRKRLTTE